MWHESGCLRYGVDPRIVQAPFFWHNYGSGTSIVRRHLPARQRSAGRVRHRCGLQCKAHAAVTSSRIVPLAIRAFGDLNS